MPLELDAADHALLQIEPGARDMGAHGREDALHPAPRVGRAADHLHPRVARIDDADAEPVGVGMGLHLDDMGHHEGRQRASAVDHRLDLDADRREAGGDLLDPRLAVEMVLEPAQRQLHRLRPPTRLGTSSGMKP